MQRLPAPVLRGAADKVQQLVSEQLGALPVQGMAGIGKDLEVCVGQYGDQLVFVGAREYFIVVSPENENGKLNFAKLGGVAMKVVGDV